MTKIGKLDKLSFVIFLAHEATKHIQKTSVLDMKLLGWSMVCFCVWRVAFLVEKFIPVQKRKELLMQKLKTLQSVCKNKANNLAVLSLFYILSYEIPSVRKWIKQVLFGYNAFVGKFPLPLVINVEKLKEAYLWGQHVCYYYILAFLACTLLLWIIFAVADQILKKQIEDNPFDRSLSKYLQEKSDDHCYLVTGIWGSGKTYSVNAFFDKYYQFSGKKIYRISCFGLSTRESLLTEINNIIEKENNGGYSSFLQVLRYIPIVGNPLSELLRKSYHLGSIKQNSIFIFDDFERVTSRGNLEVKNETYRKRHFPSSESRQLNNLAGELERVRQSAAQLEKESGMIVNSSYLEKYNAIIGLINELIESYGMKVIVICNVDILGYEYFNNIFRDKLNCKTYNKSPDSRAMESITGSALKGIVFKSKTTEEIITGFWEKEKEKFQEVWYKYGNHNLRFVDTFFKAFIYTAADLDEAYIKDTVFLESLFYSIYTVHCLDYENDLSYIRRFHTGGNILFYLSLYNKSDRVFSMLENIKNPVRWVDVALSGYWLLNMSAPENAAPIYESFQAYPHAQLELDLLMFPVSVDMVEKDYLLEHVIYLQTVKEEGIGYPVQDYLKEDLIRPEEYHDKEACLYEILELLVICTHGISHEFRMRLMKILYDKLQIPEIHGEGYVYREYNEYVEGLGR